MSKTNLVCPPPPIDPAFIVTISHPVFLMKLSRIGACACRPSGFCSASPLPATSGLSCPPTSTPPSAGRKKPPATGTIKTSDTEKTAQALLFSHASLVSALCSPYLGSSAGTTFQLVFFFFYFSSGESFKGRMHFLLTRVYCRWRAACSPPAPSR